MKEETIGTLIEKMKVLYEIEVAKKLRRMKVDEKKDRLRIIFEFEFKGSDYIRNAVEIRHRRPWK